MREEQFIELQSQGSIYSATRLGNNLIVGTGNFGKVFSYATKGGTLEEVTLPDLPLDDIEIVALDAFPIHVEHLRQSQSQDDCAGENWCPVLAVTFVHKGGNDVDDKPKAGLHIYSSSLPESPSYSSVSSPDGFSSRSFSSKTRVKEHMVDSGQLDMIGQRSSRFPLNYIPFDLFHVPLWLDNNDSYGHIFLLTGSDRRVHTFQATEDKNIFTEVPVEKHFPELAKEFESIVTRVQVECLNETTKRISLCGCDDGTLHVWIVKSCSTTRGNGDDSPETDIIQKIEHNFDGMITSIQSFTEGFHFNIIVASACSPTYIYTNTVEDNFTTGVPLKFSSRWDTVEAVCIADIDLDGRAEIILGTFGCTMLVYKYMEMDDITSQWVIVAHKKFCSGILSIKFIDYVIHVITSSGIHVIEYSTRGYFNTQGICGATEELPRTANDSTNTEKTDE